MLPVPVDGGFAQLPVEEGEDRVVELEEQPLRVHLAMRRPHIRKAVGEDRIEG